MSQDAVRAYSLADRLEYWESLSWTDLNNWAGASSVRRGRSDQRGGQVRQLSLSDDGWLLATVQGTSTYAVSVWIESAGDEDGRLKSECTCPIGHRCKHAVAVIAEYLDAVACGRKVPKADVNDPRWEKLARLNEPYDNADDEDDGEFEVDDFDNDGDRIGGRLARDLSKPRKRSRSKWDERIAADVAQMSVTGLREVVTDCLRRFPELCKEFQERLELAESKVPQLVAQARRAIEEASAEPGWTSRWGSDSSIPDYSRVKSRFQKLAEVGAHDALAELGLELLSVGTAQVEQSHDEGETGDQIRSCLAIAFKSLAKAALSPEKKIVLAIDACLNDDYELVDESISAVLDANWGEAVWSTVADQLSNRLNRRSEENGDFHDGYRRDCLSRWLVTALEKSGLNDEIRPLLESEAPKTNSYDRLVSYLLEQGDDAAAEEWAREGIQKTLTKWPGIADSLRKKLCDIASRREQWDVVAAHSAAEFFQHPSKSSLERLLENAGQAGVAEQVRPLAMMFLQTGEAPFKSAAGNRRKSGSKKSAARPDWPLPILPELEAQPSRSFARTPGPFFDLLIDLAIEDGRYDDVLKWYDAERKQRPKLSWPGYEVDRLADRVVAAIEKTHPEEALAILKRQLSAAVPATQHAYEQYVDCLRRMKPIYDRLGRAAEWSALVDEAKATNKRRRNFVELLNQLDGVSIVDARRRRR